MDVVSMQSAFRWLCDNCGEEHFVMPVKAEFVDLEEREEVYRGFHRMAEYEQLPDHWEEFELVSIPEKVTCRKCGQEYATENESL